MPQLPVHLPLHACTAALTGWLHLGCGTSCALMRRDCQRQSSGAAAHVSCVCCVDALLETGQEEWRAITCCSALLIVIVGPLDADLTVRYVTQGYLGVHHCGVTRPGLGSYCMESHSFMRHSFVHCMHVDTVETIQKLKAITGLV